MAVNKYLGPTGLTELINLIQADLQKKQDWMQFPEMPEASLYQGKVVQFTGVTDATYTKGSFYYSTGLRWLAVGSNSKSFEVVETLPDWPDANPDVLYLVPDDAGILSIYKKDPDTTGKFLELSGNDTITTEDIEDIFDEVFGSQSTEDEETPGSGEIEGGEETGGVKYGREEIGGEEYGN